MPYFLSPIGNSQILDANGNPLVGGTIETYLANTSTPATTYTDNTGGTAQGVVMTLNSLGLPTLGPVWMLGGVPLKFIIKNASGVVQPPTQDDIIGIGDSASAPDQFPLITSSPTYISATSFSLVGDQTNDAQRNRRIRSINSGGTVYSTIISSVFSAGITTVTVVNDSGVLDAGLSQVNYGLLTSLSDSMPRGIFPTIQNVAGQLFGLTLSNNVADATNDIDIAAGVATDSTNAYMLTLSSVMTKRLDAAWAVGSGNGGLDTGSIANTTYHVFVIRKDSDGSIDALFSTSATAPTMPSGYTYKRRIGSIIRASAAILAFSQRGDEFLWKSVATADYNTAAPATAVSVTVRTPAGVQVDAILNAAYVNTSAANFALYISSLDQNDEAATTAGAVRATCVNPSTTVFGVCVAKVRTNTSAQVRIRSDEATNATRLSTVGYIDSRGKE